MEKFEQQLDRQESGEAMPLKNVGKYGKEYLPEIQEQPIETKIELLVQTKNIQEFLWLPDAGERTPFHLKIKPDYLGPEFIFDSNRYTEVIKRNQVYHYTSVINLPMIFTYGLLPEAWRNPEQFAGLEGVVIDKGSYVDRYEDYDSDNRFMDKRELVIDPHLKRVSKHEQLINKTLEHSTDTIEKLKNPSQDPNMGLFIEGKEEEGEIKWNSPTTVSGFYAYLSSKFKATDDVPVQGLVNEFASYPVEALFDLLSDDIMRPNLILEDCEVALQSDPDESHPKLYRGGGHRNEIAISGRTKPSQIKGIFFVAKEPQPDFNKKVSEWPSLQKLYTPLIDLKREYQDTFNELGELEKNSREGKRYEALISFFDHLITQGEHDTLFSFYKSFQIPIYATYRIDPIATGQYETGLMSRMADVPTEPRDFLSDFDPEFADREEKVYRSRIQKFGFDKILNNTKSMNFRVFEEL